MVMYGNTAWTNYYYHRLDSVFFVRCVSRACAMTWHDVSLPRMCFVSIRAVTRCESAAHALYVCPSCYPIWVAHAPLFALAPLISAANQSIVCRLKHYCKSLLVKKNNWLKWVILSFSVSFMLTWNQGSLIPVREKLRSGRLLVLWVITSWKVIWLSW